MKKSRIIALLLVAVMLIGVLTACGSTAPAAPASTAAPAATAAPAEPASPDAAEPEITITVGTVIATTGAWAVGLNAWADKTAELSNGRIKIEVVWDSLL